MSEIDVVLELNKELDDRARAGPAIPFSVRNSRSLFGARRCIRTFAHRRSIAASISSTNRSSGFIVAKKDVKFFGMLTTRPDGRKKKVPAAM